MTIKELVKRKKVSPAAETEEGGAFARFHADMNRLMENFWSDWGKWPMWGSPEGTTAGMFTPRIEVSESNGVVDVTAELPGMTEDDVEVTLSADSSLLTIKGEKKFEDEKKDSNFYHFERSYGSFQRTLPLPARVGDTGVKTSFKDGVLTLHLPKLSDEAQGIKKIDVKS